MNLVNNIKSEITDMLNINIRNYDDTLNEFQSHIDRQDDEISVLHSAVSTVDKKYTDLTAKVKEISDKMDLKIRSKKFTILGNDNTIVPVIFQMQGGEDLPTVVLDKTSGWANGSKMTFMGGMFITYSDSTRNVILQLGSNMETNYTTQSRAGNEYTITQNCWQSGKGIVHCVQRMFSGTWVVWLLGNRTYYLWSKYVDDVSILSNSGYNGIGVTQYAVTGNHKYIEYTYPNGPQQVFKDRLNSTYSFHYTDVLNITRQLTLGSRYVLSIVQ